MQSRKQKSVKAEETEQVASTSRQSEISDTLSAAGELTAALADAVPEPEPVVEKDYEDMTKEEQSDFYARALAEYRDIMDKYRNGVLNSTEATNALWGSEGVERSAALTWYMEEYACTC